MNRKLTEEEIDAKFEEFMQKLSTDEDSSQSKPLPKQQKPEKKDEPKDTLWWLKGDSTGAPASSKSGQSWLKAPTKMVSPEKASKPEISQLSENAVTEAPAVKKGENDQARVSEHENPVTIDSESSAKGQSALTADSKESQEPTQSGVYSEDFESGKMSTNESDESKRVKKDRLQSKREHLNTLSDVTFNSEDSEGSSSSEDEMESATGETSERHADGGEISPAKQSSSEGEVNVQESEENSQNANEISTNVQNDLNVQRQKLDTGIRNFGRETFVIKSNVRGIDEILKEAEEIEKSMSAENRSDRFVKARPNGRVRESTPPPSRDTENTESKKAKTEPKKPELDIFHSTSIDVANLQRILKEERRRYAKLQAEAVALEKENTTRFEKQRSFYETKVLRLETDNIHLSAKIDELRQQLLRGTKIVDGKATTEQTDVMLKEFKEQETLIAGYQKENEQLYEQLKTVKNELKVVQTNMHEENQRLTSELAIIKRNSRAGRKEMLTSNTDEDDHYRILINEFLREIAVLKAEKRDSLPGNEIIGNELEISELKNKIVALENEIRKRNLEHKSMATIVASKESKIRSLENQVKHLEQLVNVRNPNSISALVLAAGAAEDGARQNRTEEFLERRVQELEEKLASQNSQANESLKAIQEKYAKLKEQYEARIGQLEDQKVTKVATTRPQSSVAALEKELDGIRERHRRETEKLRKDITTLQQEAKQKNHRPEDHHLFAKVKSLTGELATKEKQNRILREKLDGIKIIPAPPQSIAETNADPLQVVPSGQTASDQEYKEENRNLRAKVEQLICQIESLRGALQRASQQDSTEIGTVKEDNRKLMDAIAAKEVELDEAKFNLDRALAKISELNYTGETHDVIVGRLREKLANVQSEVDQVRRLRSQNAELRLQCHEIRERLVLAEAAHPPEWKHYAMLQARVHEVERRYEEKSEELRATMRQFQVVRTDSETNLGTLQKEVDKWKALVFTRNRDIERFRHEMNDIIRALELLMTRVPPN